METPVLSDKNQFPSEEIIYLHIGKCKPLWELLFKYIHSNNPDFEEEWKYYNDGKSWLLKVTRKSKTIFWLSIIRNGFRTTFYFPSKAEEAILKSKIAAELKNQFINKAENKIRGITIIYKNKKDIDSAKELIELKLKIN